MLISSETQGEISPEFPNFKRSQCLLAYPQMRQLRLVQFRHFEHQPTPTGQLRGRVAVITAACGAAADLKGSMSSATPDCCTPKACPYLSMKRFQHSQNVNGTCPSAHVLVPIGGRNGHSRMIQVRNHKTLYFLTCLLPVCRGTALGLDRWTLQCCFTQQHQMSPHFILEKKEQRQAYFISGKNGNIQGEGSRRDKKISVASLQDLDHSTGR